MSMSDGGAPADAYGDACGDAMLCGGVSAYATASGKVLVSARRFNAAAPVGGCDPAHALRVTTRPVAPRAGRCLVHTHTRCKGGEMLCRAARPGRSLRHI